MPKIVNVAEFLPGGRRGRHGRVHAAPAKSDADRDDIAFIEGIERPMLIKGVLTGHDPRLALRPWRRRCRVSDRGGRQRTARSQRSKLCLRSSMPTMTQVVMIDGGFREGADIIKALALGAKGVLVGRGLYTALRLRAKPCGARARTSARQDRPGSCAARLAQRRRTRSVSSGVGRQPRRPFALVDDERMREIRRELEVAE